MMKLSKKLIAVPALALAAGLSLTACGGNSNYAQGKAYEVQHSQDANNFTGGYLSDINAWCISSVPDSLGYPSDAAGDWMQGCDDAYNADH
jgi:hypothetical protein